MRIVNDNIFLEFDYIKWVNEGQFSDVFALPGFNKRYFKF